MSDDPQGWHLDKRVPIAFIFVLMAQFAGGVWFMSRLSFEVERTQAEVDGLQTTVRSISVSREDLSTRVIRIEEQLINQKEILTRIERAVSKQDGGR